MKKTYLYTALLSLTACISAHGQELTTSNTSSFQQSTPIGGSANSTNTLSRPNNSNINTNQNSTKGQIGINTQSPTSNVNSPVKETEDVKTTFNKDNTTSAEEKNQLQIFINQTTGKDLELYGYSLFRKSNFSPIQQIPAPIDYTLGPGDEIDVKVWGSIEFNIRQIVDRDGRITLPQIGSFGIAGTKVANLDEILKKQISRIYKGFEVSGTLAKIRSIQIYVVGNAKKPGAYTVSGMSTLISALFEASGPSINGSMRKIRLIRDGKEISQIDLYDFIKNGDNAGNIRLTAGDVIQIPSAGTRVGLIGAIDGQAIYELKDNSDSLSWLINFVGEKNTLITPQRVIIERINNDSTKANRSVEEKTLNEEGMKFSLKDGDLITLSKINHQYQNAVTLKGIGPTAIRFKFKEGMRVSDVIPDTEALIQQDYFLKKNMDAVQEETIGDAIQKTKKNVNNLLNEINWNYAAIERLDRKEVKSNLIPFNLGKAIKEKDINHDLTLLAGDTIIVYNTKDIQIPQSMRNIFVKVSGEINSPGLYQVKQGESLVDLIKRGNGLTKDAYLYGTSFTRESVKKIQQENLAKALNRIEDEINSQSNTLTQNSTNQESVVYAQQQLVSQKAFLNKLKSIQPSGRITLEINPEEPNYPDLTLEDGDEIIIPNKPSFINVTGSVYTDSTFLYRPNLTVRDYLAKAGPTREADTSSLIVIKADASIDSDNLSSGLFRSSIINKKLQPGDTVFVPEVFDKRNSYTQFMLGLKDWTTVLYQFGIGAAAWKTLKN